jgi:hypothetical protein
MSLVKDLKDNGVRRNIIWVLLLSPIWGMIGTVLYFFIFVEMPTWNWKGIGQGAALIVGMLIWIGLVSHFAPKRSGRNYDLDFTAKDLEKEEEEIWSDLGYQPEEAPDFRVPPKSE